MRPTPVIDAIKEYYEKNNACGGRVKYKWGQKVDRKIEETRELVLGYLGVSSKNFVCSFTLNTSYGLNLVQQQLPIGVFERVVTSEIEHNSVFLTTIELSKRLGVERLVLDRAPNGELIYEKKQLKKAVVVLNVVSNIDGRSLKNIKDVISDVHTQGGIVIIDAAQAMAHCRDILVGCDADVICFSAHKMYASSLGVIVIKKKLLESLDIKIVGGGMVTAVRRDDYDLIHEDMASWLEPGLQAYGEIISLNASINWLRTTIINGQKPVDFTKTLSKRLFDGLSDISGLNIINNEPSTVISLYSEKIDAHRLASFLSESGIMVRSGYFCCHYYLIEKMQYPPLVRFSVGLQTTESDIDRTIAALTKIMKG
jgi:cysteine desulfurase/selenocysteine lyase